MEYLKQRIYYILIDKKEGSTLYFYDLAVYLTYFCDLISVLAMSVNRGDSHLDILKHSRAAEHRIFPDFPDLMRVKLFQI